ncbi:hypothetical protein [Lacticaseibacillus pantheris]|jgi:hypothetical protein|uniref:Uncharacterized protein n=1 Tax=Lacticaseibacillus pantheris DSM 15945 = JCM 12539 = NBRC 106106 TaxID=1423783 RepID=A0A0R1U004_9LACO|nr:hypothetical protein [Lacticaseibacillus pantheris]KRL86653.1 hypothetical protein FC50_GL000616 [Lacticaseibacillus pantheris DSM 15945 = JCM 12539 = NBRC 106106]WKF84071.1 hypothetical protein QY874_07160 [Lacticaseibacillus pantheris]
MDVFQALKLLQVNHQPASQRELVVTDPTGKPDATMSALLADVLGKLAIFGDLDNAHSPEELINQLHAVTPLPSDVLAEYDKILTQRLEHINFATHKQIIELVYHPFV